MKKTAKKIEEFFLGKKVERNLVTDCSIDFKETNLFNLFSIFQKGGIGVVKCNFSKGEKDLGKIDIHFNLTKNGLKTKVETSKGIFGVLARESNIINDTLNI